MSLRKNKFYSLYQHLTDKERKKLCFYVLYRQQNPHHELYRLAEILQKSNIGELEKEDLFEKVFPGRKYNDLKIRKLLTLFLRLIEDFMIAEQLIDDKKYRAVQLSEVLNERQIAHYFQSHAGKAIAQIENSRPLRVVDKHYLFQLKSAFYNFEIARRRKPQIDYQEVVDSFDQYVSLEMLNLAISEVNISNLLKTKYDLPLLEYLNSYLEASELTEDPLIRIHFYGYQLLSDEAAVDAFDNFRKTLFENEEIFHSDDLRNFYTIAINHCVKQINSGSEGFAEELFRIYQRGIGNEAVFLRGVLPASTFQNIVSTALRMGETDWAEQFMLDNQQHIPKEARESIYGYSMARLEFERENYEKACDILYPLKIKDYFTELAARMLMMKAYYEMGYDELLDSQIDNFQQLLNRRKLLAYHKSNFNTFAKYLKRLRKLNRHDAGSLDQLSTQIAEERILTEKAWFLEKVEAFRRK